MPDNSGGQILALPRPGMPISFEQVEEYLQKSDDGISTINSVVSGKAHRDSAGRVHIQVETREKPEQMPALTSQIIDPVSGFRVLLLGIEKVAYRMPMQVSSKGSLVFTDVADGQESPHKWKTETQDAGSRVIDGIDLDGTRIISIAEDEPRLTTIFEQWYSKELMLFGAIDRSGPYRAYTVRVRSVRREDPDPDLFAIPPEYQIIDMNLSGP